jgi:hypothetical protein
MMHAVRLSTLRCRSRADFRTGREAGRQALVGGVCRAAKEKLQTTANILEIPVLPDILSALRCVALRSCILLLQQHSSHRALVLQLDDLMVLCLARGGEKQVIGPESRPGWPFSANPGMHGVTGCSLSGFDEGRWDTGHWDTGTALFDASAAGSRLFLAASKFQPPTSNLPRLPARLPRPKVHERGHQKPSLIPCTRATQASTPVRAQSPSLCHFILFTEFPALVVLLFCCFFCFCLRFYFHCHCHCHFHSFPQRHRLSSKHHGYSNRKRKHIVLETSDQKGICARHTHLQPITVD